MCTFFLNQSVLFRNYKKPLEENLESPCDPQISQKTRIERDCVIGYRKIKSDIKARNHRKGTVIQFYYFLLPLLYFCCLLKHTVSKDAAFIN